MSLINILKFKCPKCKEGAIFNSNHQLFSFHVPKMHTRCDKCNLKFEKESGFFIGAMYVSYGITVAEFLMVFIIFYFVLKVSLLTAFMVVVGVIILASILNFKLARTLWIYLFYNK
ncbi:DUF983 domain-containing protein [Leeuwenhoekiella marinoflava]|uniref:DUF983 domain-containing protein n=2 Tax=Leeuwenhoekiella marinoflava TaxID=988 RepID=A0A4Q0PL91_9FLAO|nr:DUF983 domain-containing protein [Leeuwenhoekiella marinoflava]RXG29096.1 putative protein DUF983 [Leeuwenhoekiella marinoflava]SHF47771.1 Protein of unknown function [Leeuwenhoekiella marinoflava DSM 3653]